MGTIDSAPATVPAITERSMSETALLFTPQHFSMECITLMIFVYSRCANCCTLHAVCLSSLDTASCLHWSFSSTTLAHYDCGIRLWFCEGLFHCSSDRWPIEITIELSACCQGNTSSLLLFMRSRDRLLTSPGEGRCQSLVHSWLHRASKNLEDLLNSHG